MDLKSLTRPRTIKNGVHHLSPKKFHNAELLHWGYTWAMGNHHLNADVFFAVLGTLWRLLCLQQQEIIYQTSSRDHRSTEVISPKKVPVWKGCHPICHPRSGPKPRALVANGHWLAILQEGLQNFSRDSWDTLWFSWSADQRGFENRYSSAVAEKI